MNSFSVLVGTGGWAYMVPVARPTREIGVKSLSGSYGGCFRSAIGAVIALFEANMRVWPWGALRVICSAARALSAPGRLSTMTGWPIWSESAWPIMRVVGSAAPPGGKPTMKRLDFAGHCATAALEAE